MARTNSTIECATTAIERQAQRPTASAHRRSPSGNPRLSAFCRSAPTDVGHRLFRWRAGSGHARRQPGSPAPAGNAGGAVDVLEARLGRVRRVHRRPEGGRGGPDTAFCWTGIGAPKNTPPAIVDKPNTKINAALADPKMKARLA